MSRCEQPSAREACPEYVGVDEVRESALLVDLEHGQIHAIAALELVVAGDVHELELEPELGLQVADDLERALAEPAVGRVVERDYGYRPRVVVASATRWTASPYDDMRRLVS